MKNALTFTHYQSYSLKARVLWAQKVLLSLGYNKVVLNGKRDKGYIKALKNFQEQHGLGGNAMVCEKTFNALLSNGGNAVRIDR